MLLLVCREDSLDLALRPHATSKTEQRESAKNHQLIFLHSDRQQIQWSIFFFIY